MGTNAAAKEAQESSQTPPAAIRRKVEIPVATGTGSFITFKGLVDDAEHLAIAFGAWQAEQAPLVRIHSECLTGDVFGSGKCDCGEQLQEAIRLMQAEGGILLYLRQEGRGIGLYNKLDAYELQARGHDTYEANRLLGLPDDERDYTSAAQMLKALGKETIRLLTNNPEKHRQLVALGIDVAATRTTSVFLKTTNRSYLAAKADKTGHLLRLPPL
jgi:GTP cyclohydrolase II